MTTMNIGQFARNVIINQPQLNNDQVLELVKKEFPAAKTTYSCIAWYRSNLKKAKKLSQVTRTIAMVQNDIEKAREILAKLEAELKVLQETDAEMTTSLIEDLKEIVEAAE